MKIADSKVAMKGERKYQKLEANTVTVTGGQGGSQGGSAAVSGRFDSVSFSRSSAEFRQTNRTLYSGDPLDRLDASISDMAQSRSDPQLELLLSIVRALKQMRGDQSASGYQYQSRSMSASLSSTRISGGRPAPGVWTRQIKASHFVAEAEQTTFSTVGVAHTEDGREIQFNMDLEMSRSFMRHTHFELRDNIAFTDPLVINLDAGAASFSDQKFMFDIDADGEQESVAQLGQGSGYLALDRNGDGAVNDGGELFGAKTGNGFDELRQYDADGNGWIDENDAVFHELRIWTKDERGNDRLVSLKDAGVGAINLGSVSTDFTLKSEASGKTNGQVRRTGFYLRENGSAGTVQHVDVAV